MFARIDFQGPAKHRIRSAAEAAQVIAAVSARRLLNGPRRPSWNWWVEVATELLKRQLGTAFDMSDVKEARSFLDSMVVRSPALVRSNHHALTQNSFKGSWFAGKNIEPQVTLLYLHGGGYSFYPQSYANFIALITLAAKSKTLALDYRLSPEYGFPSQLEDALNAYHWLLDSGVSTDDLVVAGDSAGGNLTLALLLRVRESNLPLPSLAVALSPAIDFQSNPEVTTTTTYNQKCSPSGLIGSVILPNVGIRWYRRCWPICGACRRSTYRPGAAKSYTTAFNRLPLSQKIRVRMSRWTHGTT